MHQKYADVVSLSAVETHLRARPETEQVGRLQRQYASQVCR
jgi:hypothetical protein